jgi:hypothetical protein
MSAELHILSTDTDDGTITVVGRTGNNHEILKRIRVGNAPRGSVKFTSSGRGWLSPLMHLQLLSLSGAPGK